MKIIEKIKQRLCKHDFYIIDSFRTRSGYYNVYICPKCGRQKRRYYKIETR